MPERLDYNKEDVCLRYVTARPNRTNPTRWYWQRPGFDLTALPTDPVERLNAARALNMKADGKATISAGSIAGVVAEYKETDEYKALKPGTLKYYDRILEDVENLKASLPFSAFTRKAVIAFVKTYKVGMRRQVAAVLGNLFNVAIYHEHASVNYAAKLRLPGGKRRDQSYSEADVQSWTKACDDRAMGLAFTILRFAVQRPGDVLAMTWAQYNGNTIKLRQEKTGKLVEVPCHVELRAALDDAKKSAKSLHIVSDGYRKLSYGIFSARFRRIADAANLKEHQARDLRRTAAVRMAEAGATVIEIAAIAGWSIDFTTMILETYIPRNVEMARSGILKWERKSNTEV